MGSRTSRYWAAQVLQCEMDLGQAVRLLSRLMLDPDDDKAWDEAVALVTSHLADLTTRQRRQWCENFDTLVAHEPGEPCTCSHGIGCSRAPVDKW